MNTEEVLKSLRRNPCPAQRTLPGLSSGRHSDRYLQSALVLQYPWIAEKMAQALAEKVKPLHPQLVLSPAMGGLFIGQELARALKVRSIFTERNKETDMMELRRGFTVEKGEKFFAVEDIITYRPSRSRNPYRS